ncbi:aminoglycoside 6-adenylyltransferase [Paenibacillus roseipurpureus]|uniref:Aminoglycoside 6-adenylyltransferase n=1 Tax=Paenibacillus roseopurpureus TaxID=2918901 RepID=A0AA96LPH4_9BACL|nr:aminoglycoside 6-adenylyltransferase [Paenibacillus sp. MBLB1832]WNR44922.1 aminoglycoside 6-adenylyltransferase [Paenibacillus sp. MBLB1832]
MRTEQQMMSLILDTAKQDERIRGVMLNGSRANPNVPRDVFQDYDIVYFVEETDSFGADPGWIDRFGERLILQMPDENEMYPAEPTERIVYLMQFMDGNRIDLTLIPVALRQQLLKPDSLSVLLLDKDDTLGPFPAASDSSYHIQRPTEKLFQGSCNEFWWISLNIAKGLWREELPYVMVMYEQINRNVLIQMLEWKIAMRFGFTMSAGKCGKYMQSYLTAAEWKAYTATYSDASYAHIWDALFAMCELFRAAAREVADHLHFAYNRAEERNVLAYLKEARSRPRQG